MTMKSKLNTLLFLLFVSIAVTTSCEAPLEPKGYISAVDKTPPELEIVSPKQNAEVRGIFTVRVFVKEFFGLSGIVFRNAQGNQMLSEYLGRNGDTLDYALDLSVHRGKYDIKVEAIDVSENIGLKLLSVNVTPILKYEYRTLSTGSIDVYSLKEDSKGNVWFATDEGLFKYNGNTFTTNVPGFDLPYPLIRTIAIDRNDIIWANYNRQYSSEEPRLIAFDGNQIIKNIEFPQVGSYTIYNSFAIGEDDTLYGAGYYDYFKYKDDNWNIVPSEYENPYYYVLNDNSYRIWMRSRNEIKLLKNNSWVFITPPYQVSYEYFIVDDSSNLWIQRIDQAFSLAKYNGSEWNSLDFFPSYSEIKAFDVDKNGNLWVTEGSGLFKYSGDGILIKKVTSIINIFFIKADRYNNIWLHVDFGIMRLNEDGV